MRGFVALVVAGAWLPAAAVVDGPAAPIRTPDPVTPVETTGTGLGPTVEVHLSLDELGRVTDAVVGAVRPSSEFDDLFRETARKTLSTWRFAPEVRGGKAVASNVDMAIRFTPRGEESVGRRIDSDAGPPVAVAFWGLALIDRDEEERRWERFVAGLDEPKRAALLQKRVAEAESALYLPQRTEATTDHFRVVTDSPQEAAAARLAEALEAAFGSARAVLGGRIPLQPMPARIQVYAYSSEIEFGRLRRVSGLGDDVAGFYDPIGLLAFHLQVSAGENLLKIALHEATHAFVSRFLFRPGLEGPQWLEEGLAEYVSNSKIENGRLVPGGFKKRTLYHTPVGPAFGRSTAAMDLSLVRDQIRKGDAIPLAELTAVKPPEFYGARSKYYYAESWMFVHFLRHGKPEWADGAFPEFLLAVAEGFAPDAALRAAYGETAADLEGPFREYVTRF